MSFVERVVEHVRRVQQIADGTARDKRVAIDYGRHIVRWRDALEHARLADETTSLDQWRGQRLRRFLEELHWQLLLLLGHELDADARARQIDLLLPAVVKLVDGQSEKPKAIRDQILGDIARTCWLSVRSVEIDPVGQDCLWYSVPQYCREVGAVSEQDAAWRVTKAGKILLDLRGREAIRWLLTLESRLAESREDPWRVDRGSLQGAFASRSWRFGEGVPMPVTWTHVVRLRAYGLVDFETTSSGMGLLGWSITELGDIVLREVIRGEDTSFGAMAQAVLDDERDSFFGPVVIDDRSEAMLQHTRMVAHEVRNALGPVQHASRRLRGELGLSLVPVSALGYLDAIDQGISRLHRFVTDSVRLVPPESQRLAPFSVLEAIAEARKELAPDGIGSLTIETLPVSADPRSYGHRGQFVMAMLNVLRNAQQAAGHEVQIAIRVDARDARQILLSIDDDGPGVPDAVREHIFENGVSYREDGMGHGLASLRAVVEDMGGRVRCTTSELGGARFEIMLPMAEVSP